MALRQVVVPVNRGNVAACAIRAVNANGTIVLVPDTIVKVFDSKLAYITYLAACGCLQRIGLDPLAMDTA